MKSGLELQNLIQGFKLSCQTGNFHQQYLAMGYALQALGWVRTDSRRADRPVP